MGKPRSAARTIAKKFRPRTRDMIELTELEHQSAIGHMWFCLMVASGNERAVELALRLLGFAASFAPLHVRYRRVSGRRKRQTQTHERFNVSAMPGYVFLGVPQSDDPADPMRGLPWGMLSAAREIVTPGGMSFLRGYVGTGGLRRPATISQYSILKLMCHSHIPLYQDAEFERDFDFDYGAAAPDEVLEPGQEIEIVQGILSGARMTFRRPDGVYLVCDGPHGEFKVPAAHAVAAE